MPAVTRPPARKGEELVAGGDPPALVAEDAHRDDGPLNDPARLLPRARGAALALEREAVGALAGQLRERVVQVLGRLPHHSGALVDQPLAHEPRVELDLGSHRVVAHVLDAAHDDEVGCAHRDLPGTRGGRGQRPGAHAVDGEAGDRVREAGEQRHVTAEREALVADLRCRGEDDVADPLGRDGGVATQELPDGLDRHVVRAGLPEETSRARLAKRGADAVDEDHLAKLTAHGRKDIG